VDVVRRPDGCLILTNPHPLRPAFADVVAPLAHHASSLPDRTWLAAPDGAGGWTRVSYAAGWQRVQALAAGLDRHLPPGATVAIASGNSLAHALLTYALALSGRIAAPVTPAYATRARDSRRFDEAMGILGADAVFLEGEALARAAGWTAQLGLVRIVLECPVEGDALSFEALEAEGAATLTGWRAPAIDPASPAKLMLTSGSTGAPKAVVITHANLAGNAAQIRSTFDPAREATIWPDGIVMANHLPWSHSLGGNAVLHMLTAAGGTLYIDPGTPTPEGLAASIATIKQVRPNYHLTVPLGWALLAGALEQDRALAQALFENLRIMQYGGAALTQDVYERLQAVARAVTGEEITVAAGYGATETAPTVCNVHWPNGRMGLVGLPVPGLELKLVPAGEGKLEARVRGPGITPGYRGAPETTAAAFDEEGFYRLGDALKFADPDRPELGLAFDGRLSEAFKLANGSFVPVGTVRPALVQASNGLFSDAVICGEGGEAVCALAFLNPATASTLAGQALDIATAATHPAVQAAASEALIRAQEGQPPTRRIARLLLLPSPPSLEDGEITDKGYLNQARCRAVRADEVAVVCTASGEGLVQSTM
jgi:feruloyl-CoA synthase